MKVQKAMAAIEKSEKVKISFGGARYDDTMFRSPMTVTETAQTKTVQGNLSKKNRDLSMSYGFAGNIIGMTYNGGVITEFKTRNRSYPIIFTKNGKSYKTSVMSVENALTEKAILLNDKN